MNSPKSNKQEIKAPVYNIKLVTSSSGKTSSITRVDPSSGSYNRSKTFSHKGTLQIPDGVGGNYSGL